MVKHCSKCDSYSYIDTVITILNVLTHYDDNFKFDENGRKLSKQVENNVGKGEIARYEQFLLFPRCFQKACFQVVSKGVVVWEWINQKQSS